MKPGLLLKEAPEPIHVLKCWKSKCSKVFFDSYEWQKHREIEHGEIYTLVAEHHKEWYSESTKTLYPARTTLYPTWISKDKSEGYMIIPYYKDGMRPSQRFNVTRQELENLKSGKCICGKTKDKFEKGRRKYCGDECANSWYFRKCYVGVHRNQFLYKHGRKCEQCGNSVKSCYELEMDHIIAIIFGGHPWDERNLQALCEACHKEKTKEDVAILAWYRREANYDIGINIEPEETLDPGQLLLESFITA